MMQHTAEVAFLAWPLIALVLFWKLSGAKASFLCLFGGWAMLPSAASLGVASVEGYERLIGVALPSQLLLTKATVVGFSVLLGVVLFDRERLRGLRLRLFDLPVVVWCLVPILSGIANSRPLTGMLGVTLNHTLSWGAPYLVGRAYLSSFEERRVFARGLVRLTLVLLPFLLVEFARGAFWYEAVYGDHPYSGAGSSRYFGYRPMGFFEDGNQMGMWMATAALVAVWLVALEKGRAMGLLSWRWAAVLLVGATVLFQSVGSILLLLAGLLLFLARKSGAGRWMILGVLFLTAAYLAVRALDLVPARILAKESEVGRTAKHMLKDLGRGSFGWRLKREEVHLERAWEKPVLGHGRWDWWAGQGETRPWGMWLLVLGSYGVVGLLALCLCLLGPPLRQAIRSREGLAGIGGAFCVVIFVCFLDSLLNSTFLVVIVAFAGGLVAVRTKSEGDALVKTAA